MPKTMLLIKLTAGINEKLSRLLEIVSLNLDHLEGRPAGTHWIDNQTVMQQLKISPSTLRRRRLQGAFGSTRMDGKYYYNQADIHEALKKNFRTGGK